MTYSFAMLAFFADTVWRYFFGETPTILVNSREK